MNYTNLQNESHHLHVHIIPRYKESRTFDNITFTDERWGKNPSPSNKGFKIPESTLLKIRDAIKEVI